MWFAYALITTLAWGTADLFYKKGADDKDKYSHIKTALVVGCVMGGHAITTLLTGDIGYDPMNLLIYLPVSLMYILSMVFGYYGLRYLELSISSPIQNSSGAVCCILCLVVLGQTMDMISGVAVIVICLGVFALGFIERMELKKEETAMLAGGSQTAAAEAAATKKYRIGIVAFMMPILYAIIDALGTFLDAYYLDDFEATPLVGVTEETFEDVANISYELTFLICAIGIAVFLIVKGHKAKAEERTVILGNDKIRNRVLAAVFETAGQAFYVYAMSGNGVVAAPMIASYSIVSLILSRIFLKEKLTKGQYAAVFAVIIGIAALGLAEEL